MRARVRRQLGLLPRLRRAAVVVSVGWSFGAFIGLIAAIVALAPVARSWFQGRSQPADR